MARRRFNRHRKISRIKRYIRNPQSGLADYYVSQDKIKDYNKKIEKGPSFLNRLTGSEDHVRNHSIFMRDLEKSSMGPKLSRTKAKIHDNLKNAQLNQERIKVLKKSLPKDIRKHIQKFLTKDKLII